MANDLDVFLEDFLTQISSDVIAVLRYGSLEEKLKLSAALKFLSKDLAQEGDLPLSAFVDCLAESVLDQRVTPLQQELPQDYAHRLDQIMRDGQPPLPTPQHMPRKAEASPLVPKQR